MFVEERYVLGPEVVSGLKAQRPQFGFGQLGAAVYYRTYSRTMENGQQEQWADTVTRVVNGVMSIRKDWYTKHRLPWDQTFWDRVAVKMADAIYNFRFTPPGRGLWAMGTDYVYERGALALNNCQARNIDILSRDASLIMDSLMCGVGVGYSCFGYQPRMMMPTGEPITHVIADSREGWVDSVRVLISSYETGSNPVEFDYSEIRAAGLPIKGFGGTASGFAPLKQLHERLRDYLDAYAMERTSVTRLVCDVANAIGCCVVAGNVRRSALLYLGSPSDTEFLNLKNYELYPERMEIGWMSNNSIRCEDHNDFSQLGDIAERIRYNGEPGVLNLLNIQKYGRYGEPMLDTARYTNPCAEATLEDAECCNLVEVFPTRCRTAEEFLEACELAAIYASTVSLLPTHQADTNEVIARNRRIGVSLSGVADWFDTVGATSIVTLMRKGYRTVEITNRLMAKQAGVPESIRKTVIKPSGTVSTLAGVSPGMHWPVYTRYIRRVRVGMDAPIVPVLQEAGIPHEPDEYSANTLVFEFPVEAKAKRAQRDVSIWQKGAMLTLLQRHWADQMVSNTITFDPKTEGNQIEDFLAFTVPLTKSTSLLPDGETASYAQMPYEPITAKEFQFRQEAIKEIDWSKFGGSDGLQETMCDSTGCEVDFSKFKEVSS